MRGLLDQGKSVRQIAQAHPEIGWSYAWDVAAAYERKLGAPGKFIASRAPGYVAPARDTTGDLPKASKAPKATPAKQAKALHVDAATGATVLTPKAPAKRAPKAKVATTTGDAAVA